MPALLVAVPLLTGAAAGILLAGRIPQDLALTSCGAAALALVAGTAFLADRLHWCVVACVVSGSALAGLSTGLSRTESVLAPSILTWFSSAPADGDPVVVEGTLRADAAAAEFGASLILDATHVQSSGRRSAINGGVRLVVGGAVTAQHLDQWRAGRTLRLPVLLRRPTSFRNPGVPDETISLARRDIALLGTVKSGALVEVVSPAGPIDEFASEVRARVRRIIVRHVAALDRKSAAIAVSILIGDRSGLSDEDERRLQDAGTYHVIAISGGNIAVLTASLLTLAWLFRIPYRAAAVVIIVVLLLYGQVAGGSPSVTRAVAAAVILLVARILDHRGASLNVVGIAAVLGVAADPLAVVDAGFLLSFAATAGIVLGVPRLASGSRMRGFGLPGMIGRALSTMLAATICADVAIAPIASSFFSRLTAAGLVVNFAAIPLMTIVQTASTGLVMIGVLGERLAAAAAAVVAMSAAGLLESARLVDLAPWLARDVAPPALWFCAIYYACCLAAVIRPTRTRTLAAFGAVFCLALGPPITTVHTVPARSAATLRVVVLDVGQGDATLVTLPDGSAILVDAAGLAGTAFDIGNRVVLPALRAMGVERLHALVLTHGDPDHIGGAESVLRRLRTANVWEGVAVPPHPGLKLLLRPDLLSAGRTVWRTVRPGDIERAGGGEIRVLHPPEPDWERQRVRNDDSVVLEVRYREVSILLPGDIGAQIERGLVPHLDLGRIVVLKAAHHGSATSSSEPFLEAVRPAAVIFSAGKNNRFGHPAEVVVDRFRRRGVEMFNTATDGAVFVETDGREVDVWGWSSKRRLRIDPRPR